MEVRRSRPEDDIETFLEAHGAARVARRGRLEDALAHPQLVAHAVDALRFYQRRGFRLAKLHPGAVDESRARLKPEIPAVGDHGIPLRDELELELDVGPAP
jgi:hypothetical protein